MKTTEDHRPNMVPYLLGQLSEEAQRRFEEEYFERTELFEELQIVEDELIDDYVKGRLSPREVERFETKYLNSEKRRQRVAFAKALSKTAAPRIQPSPVEQPSIFRRLKEFLFPRPSGLRWAVAAGFVVVVAGLAFLTLQTMRLRDQLRSAQDEHAALLQRKTALERQIAERQARNEQLSGDLLRERERVEKALRDYERLKHPPQPAKAEPSTILALFLSGGPLRGSSKITPRIEIPSNGNVTLRLEAVLKPEAAGKYDAVILDTDDNRVLGPFPVMVNSDGKVRCDVPARKLKTGSYKLLLTERVDDDPRKPEWSFEVVRQ